MYYNKVFYDIGPVTTKETEIVKSILDMGARCVGHGYSTIVDESYGIYYGIMLAKKLNIDGFLGPDDEFYLECVDSLIRLINEVFDVNELNIVMGYDMDVYIEEVEPQ